MVIIALFPKLFFEITHPLLEYYKQKYEGKIPEESLRAQSQNRSDDFLLKNCFVLFGIVALSYGINYWSAI